MIRMLMVLVVAAAVSSGTAHEAAANSRLFAEGVKAVIFGLGTNAIYDAMRGKDAEAAEPTPDAGLMPAPTAPHASICATPAGSCPLPYGLMPGDGCACLHPFHGPIPGTAW